MKTAGIVMVVLNVGVMLYSMITSGDFSLFQIDTSSSFAIYASLAEIFGAFLIAIIGLIFFIIGRRKEIKDRAKLKDQE